MTSANVMNEFELKIGQFKIKGIYIAVLLPLVSAIGGGVWTISGLYNQFTNLAEQVSEQNTNISAQESLTGDLSKRLVLIEQSISDNDISTLQGKLAELSTNLVAIMEAQKELMDLKDRFKDVEVSSKENALLVDSYNNRIKELERKITIHQREVDDIWKAMDAIANPLG